MAVQLRARVLGTESLRRKLKKLNPEENKRILTDSLGEMALLIQQNVRNKQLPFANESTRAALNRLHSRSGKLRRSIGINRKPLPRAIEVRVEGKPKAYAPLHEFGLGSRRRRPFMRPALDRIAPRFGEIVVKYWKKPAGI